jgi:general secretion pathway protein N
VKKYWRYLIFGIAVYLVALVMTFPAQQAYPIAAPYLQQLPVKVALVGLNGSIWSGRANTLSIDGKAIGEVDWALSFWPLFIGRLSGEYYLRLPDGHLQGDASVGLNGAVQLQDVEGRLPAAAVQNYVPGLPVSLGGTLSLTLDEVGIPESGVPEGMGVVVWQQAEVIQPQPQKLGDLKLLLSPGNSGGTLATVSDAGGPLQAEGTIELDGKRRYRIDLRLSSAEQELSQALALLGARDKSGKVAVKLEGQL